MKKKKKKLRERIIKWLSKGNIEIESNESFGSTELDDIYLFDFLNYGGANNINTGNIFISPSFNDDNGNIVRSANPITIDGQTPEEYKGQTLKIKVKPIDVLQELEVMPTPFSLIGLDDKIMIMRDKEKLIKQKYAKREVSALIERLENRKQYIKFREFFDSFQNTNDEKIKKLLEKYDLVMKPADIFIPEFPDDAVKVMKNYNEKLKKLCDKKAVFYVIATPDNFKDADGKRDPILLVQSPFGFYWQILGAWDKEMLMLSEL